MKLLALDTSTDVGSVSLLQGETLMGQHLVRAPMNLLTWLSPAIQHLLRECGLTVLDLDGIATGIGPGSFTGVRLQLATARTLAQVRGVPLYGISSLEALAFQALPHHGTILACVDARRGELFCGIFEADGFNLTQKTDFASLTPEALAQQAASYPAPRLLAGEANPHREFLLKQIPQLSPAGAAADMIQSWTIGRLAFRKRREQSGDPYMVKPLYLRASNAEIEKARSKAAGSR